MVQVRQAPERDDFGGINLQAWLDQLPITLRDSDRSTLLSACELVDKSRTTPGVDSQDWARGGDCLIAGLEIALILSDLQVDLDCLVAGILYRAVREERLDPDQLSPFGPAVSSLLQGVLRMGAIGDLPLQGDDPVLGQADGQKDNIRKMLIALVDDVRVALIKLAERTCAIRSVKEDAERRRRVGQEVFDVYAPLAHRLGIGHLKWELEDLSFRYIYSDAYRKIAGLLDGKRLDRDDYIDRVTKELTGELQRAGLRFDIAGRAKHIYSIWRKMQRKGIGFSQVYDIRAVRILVSEVQDCYTTLGLVHGLWRTVPNEFDDYIANPKENGYRSLHTAVIGPEGKILEVQIRTEQMHEEAELGVCAHWRYKGSDAGGAMASTYEEKIAWLRQVLDWHEETGDARGVAEQFSFDVAQDRVYVFTPAGDVVNLAHGATPLDFAYHVHTEIGHRCRGAKVNGTLVPLTYQLQTGERVEILKSKIAEPRRDWLQPDQGYLRTSRARAKVQHWFKGQNREDNIAAGRHLLEKGFRRLALTSVDYQLVAKKVGYGSVEDMFAAVGAGDVTAVQVDQCAREVVGRAMPGSVRKQPGPAALTGTLEIANAASGDVHIAGCCRPVPGDPVVGYLTKSRGVTVHHASCPRFSRLQLEAMHRVVDVCWADSDSPPSKEINVAITAHDRQGLLRDITGLFANAKINVLTVNTETDRESLMANMLLRVEMRNESGLVEVLQRISELPNIVSAERVDD
ncbi:MAG: bifunctional (p)ppGpp synthetase/guanosine-3',5'-bis(diphosphate) 3'-pyrophosphohydrolase [Pseudomonadota bacterium]